MAATETPACVSLGTAPFQGGEREGSRRIDEFDVVELHDVYASATWGARCPRGNA